MPNQLLDEPFDRHLAVSGLIIKVVHHLKIRTIRDICELDLETVKALKGIGIKKVDAFRLLIENAKRLLGIDPTKESRPELNLSRTPFAANPLLVFVPTILALGFKQLKIDTVEKLLKLDLDKIATHPGWGERKRITVACLKELYLRLTTIEQSRISSAVGEIVPKELLPSEEIGRLRLDEFLVGAGRNFLKHGAIRDAHQLRMLLGLVLLVNEESPQIEATDWREVPLNVPRRIENMAVKYNLTTIKQLSDCAMYGKVFDPKKNKYGVVPLDSCCGDSSLEALGVELQKLRLQGLRAYRSEHVCLLEDIECPSVAWRDVPVRFSARTRNFLLDYDVVTISDVHRVAVRSQVYCRKQNKWIAVDQLKNATSEGVKELRQELKKLAELGLERYRFGNGRIPETLSDCLKQALSSLDSRQADILKAKCSGVTLAAVGRKYEISRERARQIAKTSLTELQVYRETARQMLANVMPDWPPGLFLKASQLRELLALKQPWHLNFALALADNGCEKLGRETVVKIPVECMEILKHCLRKLTKEVAHCTLHEINSVGDLRQAFLKHFPNDVEFVSPLEDYVDREVLRSDIRRLLGDSRLRAIIRAQIVNAGVNGITFGEIDTKGLIDTQDELVSLLGRATIRMDGDKLRRRGEFYERGYDVLQIVRSAPGPVDTKYILARSKFKWHYRVLVGHLSGLFEVVNSGWGLYIHIDKLGLTVPEVKKIARWSAKRLAAENRMVDGAELFKMFKRSAMRQKLKKARELVSIAAKHPEVRRLANNMQLVHRTVADQPDS